MRHFIGDLDVSLAEQSMLLRHATAIKAQPRAYSEVLRGRTLGMIFQKSSTRTRVSFEAGMHQLGGHAIFLASRDVQLGRGEPIADTAKVLSRYVDLLLIRTFAHADVEGLAANSRVPVINALDDLFHPCQALADLLTIQEARGSLQGQHLVFVGDGNNMAHSLLCAGALCGMHVSIICPERYAPNPQVISLAHSVAAKSGAKIQVAHAPEAAEGADIVYTDVWTSMGQEEETAQRLRDFAGFQVDAAVMQRAKPNALFLHCLPAHRGEEVAAEVIDGPQSRVFEQAENRLHAQKALMVFLLEGVSAKTSVLGFALK